MSRCNRKIESEQNGVRETKVIALRNEWYFFPIKRQGGRVTKQNGKVAVSGPAQHQRNRNHGLCRPLRGCTVRGSRYGTSEQLDPNIFSPIQDSLVLLSSPHNIVFEMYSQEKIHLRGSVECCVHSKVKI